MSNPKVPTSIIDKNGKATTVHKNALDTSASSSRIAGLPITPQKTDESLSNLEHVLRNVKGINIILRQKLIKAYLSDDGKESVPLLLEHNMTLIDPELMPILRKLSVDEDYPIDQLPVEHSSRIIDDYSTNAGEFESNLRRDVESLREHNRSEANIKAEVLEMVADKWVERNASVDTAKGFYDFKLEIESMASKSVDPVQKAAFNIALDRIQYYVGH